MPSSDPPEPDAPEPPASEVAETTTSAVTPPSSSASRLMLLAIDPLHAHAYWELALADRVQALERLPRDGAVEATWILRFFDVTGPEGAVASQFDMVIGPRTQRWYIEFWASGKKYFAELGLRAGSEFVAVCRSNSIELPHAEAPLPPEAEPPPEPAASRDEIPPPAPSDATTPYEAESPRRDADAPHPESPPPSAVAPRVRQLPPPVLGEQYAAWLLGQLVAASEMTHPRELAAPAHSSVEPAPEELGVAVSSPPSVASPAEARAPLIQPAAPSSPARSGVDGLASMRSPPAAGPHSQRVV